MVNFETIVLLLSKFNKNPPVDSVEVDLIQREMPFELPSEYLEFLRYSNGGDGFLGDSYVIFWKYGDLLASNAACEANEYAPGFLLFGSDGGGEAYAFDYRDEDMVIVSMPFIGMGIESNIKLGDSFYEFLMNLHGASDEWWVRKFIM